MKNFFARHKKNKNIQGGTIQSKRLITDSPKLDVLISEWMQNEGWEFENFADFLELIGLKTPVTLKNLDVKNNSFECVTSYSITYNIKLRFGDGFDWCSEIYLTKGPQELCYSINSNIDNGQSVPRVTLERRNITGTDRKLLCYYSEYFCHRVLAFANDLILKIEIDEPKKHTDKSEIIVLRNMDAVETYLMTLENPIDVQQVYETLVNLLELSEEELNHCEKILISYYQVVNSYESFGRIELKNGQKS